MKHATQLLHRHRQVHDGGYLNGNQHVQILYVIGNLVTQEMPYEQLAVYSKIYNYCRLSGNEHDIVLGKVRQNLYCEQQAAVLQF